MHPTLILGSSSPYRKALLERLQLPFLCHSPNIDESAKTGESAADLVKRLSINKALAVYQERQHQGKLPEGLLITSDQVAVLNNNILGKPHSEENAIKQLSRFSGQRVSFLTGLCVFNEKDQSYQYALSKYHVHFKTLGQADIKRYVSLEQPLDCAGSFKCEGLGICLFEKMEGDDPNSLVGLPLISLCRLLNIYGVNPLAQAQ